MLLDGLRRGKLSEIKIIELDEADAVTNDEAAQELRGELKDMGVFMVNVMGAPGAGKTSLLERTIPLMSGDSNVGCMCTDLDTTLDSNRIKKVCDHVVQLHTGGMWPYVSAEGSRTGLMELISEDVNLVFLENLGVLISAAAWDTGATINVVTVSASGGKDAPLKYSYIFAIADAVIITKSDLAQATGFDFQACENNIRTVNETCPVFTVSANTGEGMDKWCSWLKERVSEYTG